MRKRFQTRTPQPGWTHKLKACLLCIVLGCLGAWPLRAAEKGPLLKDDKISIAIQSDLESDEGVAAHLIDVMTLDGIVTLTGTVDNLLSKERAVEIAKTIRGVKAVVDRMTLKLPPRSDRAIKQEIVSALLQDPATDSFEIDVTVADGEVTLRGDVQSWQEKQLTIQVTKGVRGVQKVIDKITWDVGEPRLDSEIREDIRRRLEADVWVDASLIKVDINQGTVTLTGSVGSAIEKTWASSLAWVGGVKSVDDSGLQVRAWAQDKTQRSPVAIQTDAEIQAAVLLAFQNDPRVSMFEPEVKVQEGVVTLIGAVDNLKAKNAAQQDALNTVGVVWVKNFLKVRPLPGRADAEIAKEIRQSVERDPYLEKRPIDVLVLNNKAYLTGLVKSQFEKVRATDAAARVNGVVAVDNDLVLQHAPSLENNRQSLRDYYRHSLLAKDIQFGLTDAVIREQIRDQLYWSPFVDSDDITVTVEDGVATLQGSVDSRMERGAAIDNAYEGGAVSVRDKLEIEPGS